MMLPATIPFARLFFRTARPQAHPGRARMALLVGYLLVWVAFGLAAVVLDMGVHRGVDAWQWLAARPWLLPGGALLVAGAFQFTDLKAKCLTECRHPAAYLVRHYRRGIGAAFAIGLDHARFCVGCCWALMVLMFAMGVANLVWMAALTALMFAEKALPGGDRLVRPVGYGLLGLGALVLLQPDWLPAALEYATEAEAAHAHQH
jgi:predicted metal-binding membrane protein